MTVNRQIIQLKLIVMKTRTLVATLIILFFFSAGYSQKEPVLVGIKAGSQLNNAVTHGVNLGLDFLKPQMTPGYHAGVFVDVPLGNGLYFSPEVQYMQKGFKVGESIKLDIFEVPIPLGAEAVTKLHYINAPINLKYKFGNDKLSGYVRGGPTFGYAMSGQVDTRINSIIDFKVASIPLNTQGKLFNDFEVGGTVGAGLEAAMGTGKLLFEVNYQRAFTDFTNLPVVDAGLKNQSIGLSIGYAIPLGGKSDVYKS